jgi:hypothetical protein
MPGLLDTIEHPADTTAYLAEPLDLFQGRFESFEGVSILPTSGPQGNNPLRRQLALPRQLVIVVVVASCNLGLIIAAEVLTVL